MFKFLKEKISSWAKKLSEKAPEPVEIVETKEKPKKKKEKKIVSKKKEEKEMPVPMKFNPGSEKYEPDLEKLESEIKKEEIKKEPKIASKGFFARIRERIGKIKISEKEFESYEEELELLLLENNVALEIVDKIIKNLKERIVGKDLPKKEIENEVKDALKEILEEVLVEPFDILKQIREKSEKPYVILFCGINGSGKTTTIAKMADYLKRNKITSVLAAGDTFRAASIEQLKKHGEKLGVRVVAHDYGSDPAAVGFDAVAYAKKHNIDVVLIDTAGRMHTAKNLLKEMEKIVRVCKPDIKLFIGESITGNDAVEQVKSFDWAIGIDGMILSKADIDEKGGTALSLGYATKKPILFLGTGQEYKNLEPFKKEIFIEKLGL